jgi:S1-C subfamily serine protease
MNNRVLKVLALLVALSLALGVGAAVGGGIVFVVTKFASPEMIVSAQDPEVDPESGIVIAEVVSDGPTAGAGIVRGDILQKIDGQPVDDMVEVLEILKDLEPGDEVELTVLHGDDLRVLAVILGDRDGYAYLGLVPCGGVRRAVDVFVGSESGALIVEVMADSPAEEAGLEEGDVIVAVDGQELDAEHSLADLIAEYEPADRVRLEVQRPGEKGPIEVTVELGEHPDDDDVAYLGVRYGSVPHIDVFEGRPFSSDEFEGFEFDKFPFVLPEGEIRQGAIVHQVTEGSPASAAGLENGDVITAIDSEAVQSPQSLVDAVAQREPGDEITLTVYHVGEDEAHEIKVILGEHPDQDGKAYLGVVLGGFFRMERFEGDEPPHGFKFFEPPYDFDFDFDLPFDEWPHRFEFDWHWSPGEDCDNWSGCLGESI